MKDQSRESCYLSKTGFCSSIPIQFIKYIKISLDKGKCNFMEFEKYLKESYPGLKLREFMHRYTYKKSYHVMAEAITRFKECSCKKDRGTIKKEMDNCKKYWNCHPMHYYRYNLYREDVKLCAEQLESYIPEFFFYTLFLPFYDSVRYEVLLDDKNVMENFFRSLDIKQPITLLKLINGRCYSPALRWAACSDVLQNAAEMNIKKLFAKPSNGRGGYGIKVFHLDSEGHYLSKDGLMLNEEIIKQLSASGSFIIQAGLVQHSSLDRLYPHSVNTFRVATENMGGNPRILCGVVRIGCHGREVDNICQGGLILKINTDTGKTNDFAVTEDGLKYLKHPDTGFIFSQLEIPEWEKIKSFTLECASRLPQFKFLGWDIALTESGPIVIEANQGFGIDLFQVAFGGLRKVFGITDPGFYWKNKGKRITCV